MVFRGKIPSEKRALAIFLRQESGLSYPKIAEKCNISTSSAERICNENLFQRQNSGHSRKRGRPRKISLRMKRLLKRNLYIKESCTVPEFYFLLPKIIELKINFFPVIFGVPETVSISVI